MASIQIKFIKKFRNSVTSASKSRLSGRATRRGCLRLRGTCGGRTVLDRQLSATLRRRQRGNARLCSRKFWLECFVTSILVTAYNVVNSYSNSLPCLLYICGFRALLLIIFTTYVFHSPVTTNRLFIIMFLKSPPQQQTLVLCPFLLLGAVVFTTTTNSNSVSLSVARCCSFHHNNKL